MMKYLLNLLRYLARAVYRAAILLRCTTHWIYRKKFISIQNCIPSDISSVGYVLFVPINTELLSSRMVMDLDSRRRKINDSLRKTRRGELNTCNVQTSETSSLQHRSQTGKFCLIISWNCALL